ncbi:xylulose kinase-like isoform X2 [Anthonomus grandis grandis]|nr:xylulose kinase-like isoform X2 [Anthonomus grandis grandis]
MWVKAFDILMDRLVMTGADFSKIAALSGTAQQHGSVYWQNGAEDSLKNLNPSEFLHEQLSHSFSVSNSPIWMDSSTTKQCGELEMAVGGAEALAKITGSRGYERFTGSQIAKIYQTRPETYKGTERISLVSSFVGSLFLGKIAPIDISDGSGMNLLDIHTKTWHQPLLDACAPNLREKLGEPVPSKSVLGPISDYFVERYNFSKECQVVACTGDNPASLVGMRLDDGWLAVSLGTSDTVFLWLSEPKQVLDGHVLCNPVNEEAFMGLLCFKNGSLTRERVRNACAEGSWDIFNQLLGSTPRGNFGNMGLYYDVQEILPFLKGDFRYNKTQRVQKFTSLEVEVRACVEGQFIAKRVYAEDFGFEVGKGTKILATGGASQNKALLQVLADVFDSSVYVQEAANSAMLGSAYQAKHGLTGERYHDIIAVLPEPQKVCDPYPDAQEIYAPMTERFRRIVNELIEE